MLVVLMVHGSVMCVWVLYRTWAARDSGSSSSFTFPGIASPTSLLLLFMVALFIVTFAPLLFR